ncbi:hypothetical protein BU17DRAFT_73275 [Hysterangium stoloniferum]|nr:hypothetical protein BU17DRAFT_73275 [Hysterangium stoloniferum]
MSRISNVSNKLGEYMLKGYILTDDGCPKCSIPMLRPPSTSSKFPQHLFCSQCPDEVPHGAYPTSSGSTAELSCVSTAPTEISSSLSSPTFAPPPVTQHTLQRRAQSDMASAEIGKRMLRGWAMLAEECPNESCYGVPLVRPPLPGKDKDPKKECVVCGGIYIYEYDTFGQRVLIPAIPHPPIPVNVQELSHIDSNPSTIASESATANPYSQVSATISTLNSTISSLEQALHSLAHRLSALSGQAPPDHIKMGEVAISIEQVTNTLRAVKFLHFQEGRL